MIQSEAFQELWPITIKTVTKGKNLWRTTQGGGLKAASAKGPVTGFGAGLGEDTEGFGGALIIDDPLKPDDAQSELELDNANRRINTTVKTRLNNPKDTPIILIKQLTRFPLGTLNDKVDVCSIFAQLINKVLSQDVPVPTEEPNMNIKYGDGLYMNEDNQLVMPVAAFESKGRDPWL